MTCRRACYGVPYERQSVGTSRPVARPWCAGKLVISTDFHEKIPPLLPICPVQGGIFFSSALSLIISTGNFLQNLRSPGTRGDFFKGGIISWKSVDSYTLYQYSRLQQNWRPPRKQDPDRLDMDDRWSQWHAITCVRV